MFKVIVVVLVGLSSSAFAQDSTVYFYDEKGETIVDLKDAFSYRIVIPKDSLLYIRHYFTSNDQPILEGTFRRIGNTLEYDGPYKSFYRNGKLQREGTYSKDKRVGLWKEYYPNGQQADEQFHHDDKVVYHQHWDEAGNAMLTNGSGKFTAGTQHVEVIDSILFAEFFVDSLSGDSIYVVVEENATYTGGMDAFFSHIEKDLKYPKLAKEYSIQGKVFVQFVIDRSGKLHDATVISGIGGGCDEEALAAVRKRTTWIPGKVRGKVVSQKMVLPITFKIPKSEPKFYLFKELSKP
ncbi:MAG TPA: TonB family protein [Chryseolinea sp.]|nr:TonB family protein [Chryseolinea sp.]